MQVEIKTPMLPESVSEATVLNWHKEVGDVIERDSVLVDVETEKIVLEVPVSQDGQLVDILKKVGETVYADDVLGILETDVDVSRQSPEQVPEEVSSEKSDQSALSPAVRRLLDEHDISPDEITGTGKDGRILKGDVLNYIESGAQAEAEISPAEAPAPQVEQPSTSRNERREPMSRIRRTIADRLLYSQQSAALLTTFNEVNLKEVMKLRSRHQEAFEAKHGVRLGFMSFFVKASVEALKANPTVNAFIEDSDIVYHDYCDVGIAVSSPRGLVVPIVRNAQNKSLADIEKEIRSFGEKAKSGTLSMEELSGGTFTITNGGVFGSLVSTPIVNPPQSAILGMHKIQERPIAEDGEVVIRPMMYLALTYDHRIIDGREAVTFLVGIKENLEDPTRLLLEL